MTDRTSRFAFVAACTVAPLAVIGSAFSLYRIAEGAGLALPIALPVALDFTALAAAAQIRARRHLALAWVTLVAGVLGSAALQVADAWALGPIAWGVHGALPLAALVCFEFTVPDKATVPTEAAPVTPAPPTGDTPSPSPSDSPAPSPPPASDASPLRPRPVTPPRRKAPPKPSPKVRPAASLDDLVTAAVALANRRGVIVTELSQRTLRTELGIGDARARELSRVLKDGPEGTAAVVGALRVLSSNGAEP